jgi:hypothetical protein
MDDSNMADPKQRWGELRTELYAYLEEQDWTLLGEVDAGYYGRMKVYSTPRSTPSPNSATP